VKFRDGPAAVSGDEIHDVATGLIRLGRCGWRLIRKSEDLPEILLVIAGQEAGKSRHSGLKKGLPGSITNVVWGFHFPGREGWRSL